MNRQQEYWDLVRELDHTPTALDGTALRAKARAKRRRMGRRWGISLGSAAGVCAAFVLAVNTLPTFALACANVPVLRELAAAVAFSPSLSAAVEHDYVQYIGQSQSFDGLTLTLESVIADQQQMVVFYRVDGGAYPYYSAACDLKDENGVPLEGYAVTSGDSREELKQFQVHFKEMEEPPRKLTLDVELLGTDAEGEDHPLDHVFTFQIALDPAKTAPAVEVPVNQWVEVDGQRLLVDRLELTPTRTALYLEDDPDNTAWLQDLEFHFTDGSGAVYETIDGSVSAMGRPEGEGTYTYYLQSLYFVEDIGDLTLWLDETVWLDKDAGPVTVDLTDGSHTGVLPEEVTGLAAEHRGSYWALKVNCTDGRSPFRLEYRDPEGGTHNTGGFSRRDDRAAGVCEFEYMLDGYTWDTVEFDLDFTQIITPEEPIAVPLG